MMTLHDYLRETLKQQEFWEHNYGFSVDCVVMSRAWWCDIMHDPEINIYRVATNTSDVRTLYGYTVLLVNENRILKVIPKTNES